MTNREAGINIVREMMGDQAAAKLSASADSNTFGAPIAAYAVDHGLCGRCRSLAALDVSDMVPVQASEIGELLLRTSSMRNGSCLHSSRGDQS